MRVGIIGLGSIGQMLVKGFSKSGVVAADQLYVYNRTRSKSEHLHRSWPFVLCEGMQEVCERAELLFICTKPLDLYPVLTEAAAYLTNGQHIVSVAAGISLADLSSVYSGPISKVIPTVTSQVLRGVSLYACNESVNTAERHQLVQLLTAIGSAEAVKESVIETATILTSSAPGLIAGIMEQFAQAGARENKQLSVEAARRMLVETMLGTALLLSEENLQFDQLIEQVATKGGITQEGLNVLGEVLPASFDRLFDRSQEKHDSLKEKVKLQFSEHL